MNCKKCDSDIPKLELSEESALMIWGMLSQDLKLFAMNHLVEKENYNHKSGKEIISHFNTEYGQCHHCGCTELLEPNIDCPTCTSFNYNVNCEPSFNSEFCLHLEFRIDFNELDDDRLKGFWCDVVQWIPTDPSDLSKEKLKKSRKIETRAWLGKSGQEIYKMTIEFGDIALNKYLNNESLIDCIPDGNFREFIIVDPIAKHAVITLK